MLIPVICLAVLGFAANYQAPTRGGVPALERSVADSAAPRRQEPAGTRRGTDDLMLRAALRLPQELGNATRSAEEDVEAELEGRIAPSVPTAQKPGSVDTFQIKPTPTGKKPKV